MIFVHDHLPGLLGPLEIFGNHGHQTNAARCCRPAVAPRRRKPGRFVDNRARTNDEGAERPARARMKTTPGRCRWERAAETGSA